MLRNTFMERSAPAPPHMGPAYGASAGAGFASSPHRAYGASAGAGPAYAASAGAGFASSPRSAYGAGAGPASAGAGPASAGVGFASSPRSAYGVGAGPASAGAGPATPQMLSPSPPTKITSWKELGSMDPNTGTFTGNKKAPKFRELGKDPSSWFPENNPPLKRPAIPNPPTRRPSADAVERALADSDDEAYDAAEGFGFGVGGRRKRRSAKRTRRYKKGSKSKTMKGRKDFTTKKGSKYFDRRGRRSRHAKGSRKKRRPYSRRK